MIGCASMRQLSRADAQVALAACSACCVSTVVVAPESSATPAHPSGAMTASVAASWKNLDLNMSASLALGEHGT
jgi:hypothetical protein